MARVEILAVGTDGAISSAFSVTNTSGPKKLGIKTNGLSGRVPSDARIVVYEVSGQDDMPMRVRGHDGVVRDVVVDAGNTSVTLVGKGDYKVQRFGSGVGCYTEDGAP